MKINLLNRIKRLGSRLWLLVTIAAMTVSVAGCSSNADKTTALHNALEEVNSNTPMPVDEYTTMVRMTDADGWVTYNMSVDKQIQLNDPEEFIASMKKYTSDGFAKDENVLGFIKLVSECGRGLRYKYTMQSTGDTYEVDFTPDELKSICESASDD